MGAALPLLDLHTKETYSFSSATEHHHTRVVPDYFLSYGPPQITSWVCFPLSQVRDKINLSSSRSTLCIERTSFLHDPNKEYKSSFFVTLKSLCWGRLAAPRVLGAFPRRDLFPFLIPFLRRLMLLWYCLTIWGTDFLQIRRLLMQ